MLRPHDLWQAWTWDPPIVAGLLLSAILYGRGDAPGRGISGWERAAYWFGWAGLAIALVSPIHAAGEVLFSAHMVQHEILMLVAGPFLVLGRPLVPYLWGLPGPWRRRVGGWGKSGWPNACWRWLTRPFNAWCLHAIALWIWHAPSLFQATLSSDLVHALQHSSFLVTALLFWWALFRGHAAERNYGAAFFYVFTTAVHSSILGALLTFAPSAWYPAYTTTVVEWGLSPLEDQQIGGLVMWVPSGFLFLFIGLGLFAKWMHSTRSSVKIM